jgi:hypothetical protein
MSTLNKQDTPLQTPSPQLPTFWWPGFDYVFGYQLKMVQHFWGLNGRR